MFVHTGLRLDVSHLHGRLEFLVDASVSVEGLHQATDGDAGILGGQGHLYKRTHYKSYVVTIVVTISFLNVFLLISR